MDECKKAGSVSILPDEARGAELGNVFGCSPAIGKCTYNGWINLIWLNGKSILNRTTPAMNKAFVREPDPTDCVCPRCQVAGNSAPNSAVQNFVPAGMQASLSASAYFCETPNCEVAYFDALESVVLATDLTRPCAAVLG